MSPELELAVRIGWPFVAFLAAMGLALVLGAGRSRRRTSYRSRTRGRSW